MFNRLASDTAICSNFVSIMNTKSGDFFISLIPLKDFTSFSCWLEIFKISFILFSYSSSCSNLTFNLLEKLNKLGAANGIGRVDIVENRYVGIKSRGVYETPGGTLLLIAHRAMESVTLDKETMHKKDTIMPRYAELIYNGYWFSKERFKLQKIIDLKRNKVNGSIKLKLYKGNTTIVSRVTNSKAYSLKNVSFEENKSFNKKNVERFINFHKKKLR